MSLVDSLMEYCSISFSPFFFVAEVFGNEFYTEKRLVKGKQEEGIQFDVVKIVLNTYERVKLNLIWATILFAGNEICSGSEGQVCIYFCQNSFAFKIFHNTHLNSGSLFGSSDVTKSIRKYWLGNDARNKLMVKPEIIYLNEYIR